MTYSNQDEITEEKIEYTPKKPSCCYVKPKTVLFLEKASDIQSGTDNVLESQGNGYVTS